MANDDAPKPFTGMSDDEIRKIRELSNWERITVTYKGMTVAERQKATAWLDKWTVKNSNERIADATRDAVQDATSGVAGAVSDGLNVGSVDWTRLAVTVGVFVVGIVFVVLGIVILSKDTVVSTAVGSVVKEVKK